jgi:NitT/TauT family transport system substrate-binding protein
VNSTRAHKRFHPDGVAFRLLIRYDKWREYDPEASLLFYGLRMREIGMIKSSPQKIIADGTDWRFLSELKRELKS